ncbi:flagellar hook-associated protein FlgK [Virgibacillus sediminis]|uniref:Flagellar hook-associated protein 1 n=1 Tax=Virgibacillus sediminis TaxID=202260 RepID=A0ABV7A2U1_9BACI
MSTFHGLEMAKKALFTQQSAIHTTGHNISNANTEGYSRQRVNFEASSPYPPASRNRPQIPGQIGTGVEAGSVERIRNQYLDVQYRGENGKAGFWEAKAGALSRMENILNEPSETGLAHSMDQFWQSLQDLSVNPENTGARRVVMERGEAVAETFRYLSDSISGVRDDLRHEMETTVDRVNSLASQIHEINQQVKQSETHGYTANDMYDRRDKLIDELSGILDISVSYDNSHASSKIADGIVSIDIKGNNGASLKLLEDGKDPANLSLKETEGGSMQVTVGGEPLGMNGSSGSLSGMIKAHDEDARNLLVALDNMAAGFVSEFNQVHKAGTDLEGEQGGSFFEISDGTASSIKVALGDPNKIAAGLNGTAGDGANARNLADVFDRKLEGLDNKSVKGFYEAEIGKLGVEAQEANRMAENTDVLRSQVENQRMSVSGVSLDEEMSNMIKFQHAYNAAARSMTVTDELLDRIINNMGLAGR